MSSFKLLFGLWFVLDVIHIAVLFLSSALSPTTQQTFLQRLRSMKTWKRHHGAVWARNVHMWFSGWKLSPSCPFQGTPIIDSVLCSAVRFVLCLVFRSVLRPLLCCLPFVLCSALYSVFRPVHCSFSCHVPCSVLYHFLYSVLHHVLCSVLYSVLHFVLHFVLFSILCYVLHLSSILPSDLLPTTIPVANAVLELSVLSLTWFILRSPHILHYITLRYIVYTFTIVVRKLLQLFILFSHILQGRLRFLLAMYNGLPRLDTTL